MKQFFSFFSWNKISGLILFTGLAVLLMALDPFGLDPAGSVSSSLVKVWYAIPAIMLWVRYFSIPEFGRSSVEIKAVWVEKAKSIFRLLIQLLGMLVALNQTLKLNIKLLEPVFNAINYLSENIDTAAAAVGVIIGIVMNVIALFADPKRFEIRAATPKHNGKKIQ